MAQKNNSRPKGTGFAGEAYGTPYPKGTKVVKNNDGTVKLVQPKEKKKKK